VHGWLPALALAGPIGSIAPNLLVPLGPLVPELVPEGCAVLDPQHRRRQGSRQGGVFRLRLGRGHQQRGTGAVAEGGAGQGTPGVPGRGGFGGRGSWRALRRGQIDCLNTSDHHHWHNGSRALTHHGSTIVPREPVTSRRSLSGRRCGTASTGIAITSWKRYLVILYRRPDPEQGQRSAIMRRTDYPLAPNEKSRKRKSCNLRGFNFRLTRKGPPDAPWGVQGTTPHPRLRLFRFFFYQHTQVLILTRKI
jgi:hypothetical protein